MKKLFLYSLLPIVIVLAYRDIIVHIARSWTTAYGSHGILIFAVSIYLVWIKKDELLQLRAEPALLPGGLLLFAGCFTYFAGEIGSAIVVQMLSMIPVLLGVILLFGGFSYFRIFFLPVSYLVFLTGFVEHLLGNIAIYMQQFTAWFAAVFFRLFGLPVFVDYTIIELPHITLEVVRGCSGISHIVALFALAVPLAGLAQRTWPRKIVLVFSALVIGLFANTMRIVLIGTYTMFFPNAGVHGPYEILSVTVIFFFGLLILLLFSSILDRKNGKHHPGEKKTGVNRDVLPKSYDHRDRFTPKQVFSFVVGGAIFVITLCFVYFYTPQAAKLDRPLHDFPRYIAGFTGKDIVHVNEHLRPFAADSELLRQYENDGNQSVIVYIGYFEIQDRNRKIIDYRRAWMHEESSRVTIAQDEKTVAVNRTRLRSHGASEDVYFWYMINGRIIRNQYMGKILTFLNGLFTRTNNAAVIVISTKNEASEIMPLLTELVEAVGDHLHP